MSVLLLILKILLYVIGALLILAGLLCMVRVKVNLMYVEYFSAEVKALGIRFFYYELKEKSGEETEELAEKHDKKKKKNKKSASDEENAPKEKKNVKAIINEFKDMVFELLTKFKKYLRLEQLDVKALISTEDAARTALVYAEVCSAGACLAEYARNVKNARKDCVHIKITPDFIAEKCDIDLRFAISMRIWQILSIVRTLNRMMKKAKKI